MAATSTLPSTAAGRRKGASSPTTSVRPSPTLPKIKLNLRSSTPTPTSTSHNLRHPHRQPRISSTQRKRTITHDHDHDEQESESDLTPEDEDDDDDDDEMAEQRATPRHGKNKSTPKSREGLKGKAGAAGSAKHSTNKKKSSAALKKREEEVERERVQQGKKAKQGKEGRRKGKLGEMERRRERDDKFGAVAVDGTPSTSRPTTSLLYESDSSASSFGDDESDDPSPYPSLSQSLHSLHHHQHGLEEGGMLHGLPEAFAGQEIEDLAYGADGGGDFEGELGMLGFLGGWSEHEEEDDDEADADEDGDDAEGEQEQEHAIIDHLSGSEAEHQSVSSNHDGESDDPMSSDEGSTSDDDVDEFGFAVPMGPPTSGSAGPLILMENWDGQFVLVQTRQERSRERSRRDGSRGSKGSRTNTSVAGSTVISAADQHALLIDQDAADDGDSETCSSMWSGCSDEEDGDTTDSMAEEDMPMLDSPALQQIFEEQISGMGSAVNGSSSSTAPAASNVAGDVLLDAQLHPSIIITDASGADATPSTTSATPQTPAANIPIMGTFHPTSVDPAQHAVIDGSKTATKSPFTHRRRSRRKSDASAATVERKRRAPGSSSTDVFSPYPSSIARSARYSSIPGHPRYVKAKRAAQAAYDPLERDMTPPSEIDLDDHDGDGGAMDLEDMLDSELLAHPVDVDEADELGFRFDRVPVSAYLRRNFGGGSSTRGGGGAGRHAAPGNVYSSPVQHLVGVGGVGDTLLSRAGGAGGGGGVLSLGSSPVMAPMRRRDSSGHGGGGGKRGRRMEVA